jgi:predicted O-methyltransferase YrrM
MERRWRESRMASPAYVAVCVPVRGAVSSRVSFWKAAKMKTKAEYLDQIASVAGWFHPEDRSLFVGLNQIQRECSVAGNVLEIGAYKGKSAILLGYELKPGERLTICDLFGVPPETAAEHRENDQHYRGLGRGEFESNYLRFHRELPQIVQCSSTQMDLKPGSFRFVHIDGSHQYDVVRKDIETAARIVADDGVIAVDDYRSFHTPGVAAAVWGAVEAGVLRPLCITPWKLYAVATNRPDRIGWVSRLRQWAKREPGMKMEAEAVSGIELLRFFRSEKPAGILKRMYWAARPGAE